MIRDSFIRKYASLSSQWGLDPDIVSNILSRYEDRLKIERENLRSAKMELPKYFKDVRTDDEYLYDILDGWLMEDIICEAWLRPQLLSRDPDATVELMGADSDRIIQKYDPKQITTEPDILCRIGGQEIGIELQMARRVLDGGYDMKSPKVQRAITHGSYFLWIIIPTGEFFILFPRDELSRIQPAANPLWGGKLVYHISQEFISNIGGHSRISDKLGTSHYMKLGIGKNSK